MQEAFISDQHVSIANPLSEFSVEEDSSKESNGENMQPEDSVDKYLDKVQDTLKDINSIKYELCKLPLNPCESQYITNNINPLLNILYLLSQTSSGLSDSVKNLTLSSIVHPKTSNIRNTIHLIYKINDECDDIYEMLKKRLKILLDNC